MHPRAPRYTFSAGTRRNSGNFQFDNFAEGPRSGFNTLVARCEPKPLLRRLMRLAPKSGSPVLAKWKLRTLFAFAAFCPVSPLRSSLCGVCVSYVGRMS